MRKKVFIALCMIMVVAIVCATVFTACNKEFTIQYTDESGTHQISVMSGMPYSLDDIPTKSGYVFTGLFDAEVGGKQYVSASGASLAPFSGGKNLVLFPQFQAKEYTVVLDYQGAQITGERQFTVAYDTSLPTLPKDLSLEHKTFSGWYTAPNCQGKQIADQYGLLPKVSVLTEENFDVSGDTIDLYAGFETEKFEVTCFFGEGITPEYLQVEYGTPISQVVPNTRIDGLAPLNWSTTQGGEIFNGKITGKTTLYAIDYAPVIELDSNGGDKVLPIVARPNSIITLPTPTKDMAKFAYWEDMQGNIYTSTQMPSKSITLKAVWKAKIVFDSNGGSDVDEIALLAGEDLTLPIPEKENYIFAGWYTADKDQYTSTKMPAVGVKLKAGWYKEKKLTKIYVGADNSSYAEMTPTTQEIYMNELDPDNNFNGKLNIKLEIYLKTKHYASVVGSDEFTDLKYGLYSRNERSTSTTLYERIFEHNNLKTYQQRQITTTINIEDGKFYIIYNYISSSGFRWVYIKDYYINFYYPDTSNLYL